MAIVQPLLKPFHPIIDWGNPITKGLVFESPFYEGAGKAPADIVTNNASTFSNSTVWNQKQYGNVIDFPAVNNGAVNFVSKNNQNSLSKISIEFIAYARTFLNTGGMNRTFAKGASGDTSKYFDLGFYGFNGDPTSNCLDFGLGQATTGQFWQSPANSILTNIWYHSIFTMDMGSSSNTPAMYINGIKQTVTQAVAGSGAINADTTALTIGNRPDLTRGFDGYILYTRMWNRLLTPTEAISLYTNPWQIYVKPNYNPFYVPSPAVGGTAIKMQAMRGWSWAI